MAGILQTLIGSLAGVIKDAYYQYVTLLLPGNGTNGAQNNTFLDASTNNFTITRNGNTTQGTFTPYGANWSNSFSGSGQYLTGPTNNVAFQFGTGDFTVEAWVYSTSFAAYQTLIDVRAADTASAWGLFIEQTSGKPYWYDASGTQLSSTGLTLNTWQHLAVARSGSTIKIFIDGTQVFSGTNNNSQNASGTLFVGRNYANSALFSGYISNLRVVKGTAVYTSAFTPSTTPLTAISGTSLLTCQSNRFIDNSTNAFAITVTGTPSVQRFSPFSPSAAYSTSVVGGSGYFDGTGDYLSVPDSTGFDLNSTFTLECWFYQPSAGDAVIFSRGGGAASWSTTNGNEYWILISSGTIYWQWNNAGSATAISTTTPSAAAWHHIAIGYNNTTTRVWIDGASVGTSTTAYTLPTTRNVTNVGMSPYTTLPFTGYISNLRVVKGTDVYGVGNASITVPTAPLTAITNTSLLLLGTNAGVYDNAMMNDLETVGNAQISTTQSKFGGSSMYFDGAGDGLITKPSSTNNFAMGTGDWTVEFWLYLNSTAASQMVFDTLALSAGSGTAIRILVLNTGAVALYQYSTAVTSGGSLTTSTWYHVAVCKASGTTRIFVDGTQANTNYTDSGNYSCGANRPIIGINGSDESSNPLNGYIDDLRITKGYARYTANFTAPTAAFPTQ